MRFFFISPFSLIFLGVIYVIGTWILIAVGSRLKKRWRYAWIVMAPLFFLLYVGPVAEELLIAANFARLCNKDAGIFVYKTVGVDGFYDDTHSWRADKLRESGFRWMEGRDRTKFERTLWRHEWVGDEIRSFKIDHPTARYHYVWPPDVRVSHKVEKIERSVLDVDSKEVLARETKYRREAPWFFIGLDRPVLLCPAPGEHPLSRYGSVFNLALKPNKKQ